jgi:hypothetical protein
MTRTGAVLKLDQPTERTADPAPGASHAKPSRPAAQAVVGLTFEGANPDPAVAGQGLLEGVSNYLLGDDPDEWLTGVHNYSRVAYRDLYDGVSLEYYANRGVSSSSTSPSPRAPTPTRSASRTPAPTASGSTSRLPWSCGPAVASSARLHP